MCPRWTRLRTYWQSIKLELVGQIDRDYGVFEGTTFKAGLFAGWLAERGIAWPRTTTGLAAAGSRHLPTCPRVTHSWRRSRNCGMRSVRCASRIWLLARTGAIGRCCHRSAHAPGRNTPSNTRFIFGPSVWLRGLIKPPAIGQSPTSTTRHKRSL
jgi:hypothetical protein